MLGRGDILVIQTPSMGTTAPAGSLVLTLPLRDAPLRVGMIVAFHVPGTGQVYMHRVAQLLAGGRFRTRGDLNSSDDAWELTRSAVVGVPVAIVPDLGWLVMALPWALAVLVSGTLLIFVLPRWLRPAMRSLTVGGAVAVPLYYVRPFVRVAVARAERVATFANLAGGRDGAPHVLAGGVTMASSYSSGSRFLARLVNAGVLPLRVSMHHTRVTILPGHAGIVAGHLALRATSALEARPLMPLWGWAVLAVLVFAPVIAGLVALRERSVEVPGAPPRDDDQRELSPPH
jgi:hypothetical protein